MWVITLDPRTWWKGTDLAMTITCYTYDVAVKGALARCMHSFAPSLGAWMAATHNTCNMLSYPRKMYAFICTFAWWLHKWVFANVFYWTPNVESHAPKLRFFVFQSHVRQVPFVENFRTRQQHVQTIHSIKKVLMIIFFWLLQDDIGCQRSKARDGLRTNPWA